MKHHEHLLNLVCAIFSFCKADIDDVLVSRASAVVSQYKLGSPITITWRRLSNAVRMTAYVGDECLVRTMPRHSDSLPFHPDPAIEEVLTKLSLLIRIRDSVDIVLKTSISADNFITEFK